MTCKKCGAPVSYDEAGLNKKLIARDATEFLCIECLSLSLDVPCERLREKIGEYRRSGCLLFARSSRENLSQAKEISPKNSQGERK